jgi:integrase
VSAAGSPRPARARRGGPAAPAPAGATSFKVRIWGLREYKGKRGRTYSVRWLVAGHEHHDTYKTRGLADSFRSKLVTHANDGVPFDIATGLPAPMPVARAARDAVPTWYQHAVEYASRQWPAASPKQRASIADSLATATAALAHDDGKGAPEPATLRRALTTWAFNTNARSAGPPPPRLRPALDWIARNSLRIDELADPEVMEHALAALAAKLDGTPAAANTYRRKRPIFSAALKHAVKRKRLPANPLDDPDIEFTPPAAVEAVDPRTVPNPRQAEALIAAAGDTPPAGPALKAFFGCLYYAGMRPGEAAWAREDDFDLPDSDTDESPDSDTDEWGTVYLDTSAPQSGSSWTDTGKTRQGRQLKHRPAGTVRPAPVPPPLARLIREHIDRHGATADGRLFRGHRGGELAESTYSRVWKHARQAALTPAEAASPLAARPYDLRHACVSLWLQAGVDPARIATWAGHSIAVLHRVYAHCLAGGDTEARRRVADALRDCHPRPNPHDPPPTPGRR